MTTERRDLTAQTHPRRRRARSLAHAVFFLSGTAALVYEVSWARQVGMVLGHTAVSAALVLSAYFIGQAIGQILGGRVALRLPPLLGYAAAELLAAAWACIAPTLLTWSGTMDLATNSIAMSNGTAAGVRTVLCLAILLPATIPLGATLPLMAEHLSPLGWDQGRRVALGYAFNTIGGLLGVFAAIILMTPIGVQASGYLAAGLSAGCGLAAVGLMAIFRETFDLTRNPVPKMTGRTTRMAALPRGWLSLAAVSGFGTLGLEVLYTRLFALVFHNSTYTFGAVLGVFLAGLGLGAAAAAALGRRFAPHVLAAAGCAFGAAAVAASVVLFVQLTGLEYFVVGDSFVEYLAGAFGLTAVVILPPVTLLGMVLPSAFLAAGRGGGRAAGRLAAVNTVAAAAGALATGFVWTPRLGLWGAFAMFSLLFGVAGAAMLLRMQRRALAGGFAVGLAAATALVLASPEQSPAWRTTRSETVVRRWEGEYGWIDVVRSSKDGALKVRQNLHYRHGSTGLNAVREYRQGRLPLLLHPYPSDVSFLGLGTGLTAAPVVTDCEVQRAVVVELIPEVVEASRLLTAANLGVIDHPKVRIRVDDARHYLLRTDRQFDVIVSDLYVPWESRTGYLYTVEHYAAARRRLKPGGLFCQWLALYQVGSKEFELIADSFASVFPETTIWWGHLDPQFGIVALIGGNHPLNFDTTRLDRRWDSLGTMPGGPDLLLGSPSDLPGLYLGQWPVRPGRRLNSDEHRWIEFTAPISHRTDRTLKDRQLRAYFDDMLSQLPAGRIRFGTLADPEATSPRRRLALQRLILFGAPTLDAGDPKSGGGD